MTNRLKNIPSAQALSGKPDDPKPSINLGDTVSKPKRRAPQTAPVKTATTIGDAPAVAGRPAVRANRFGSKATLSWVTYEAQKNTFLAVMQAAGIEVKTEAFETALALMVREYNEHGTLEHVDLSLAQSPDHIKS